MGVGKAIHGGWLKPSKAAEGETRMRIAQGSSDINHIDDWHRLYSYVSGKRSGRDWNFETPTMVPGAETPGMVDLPDNAYRELYEYPARAIDPNAAERAERLRVQAVEADHDRVEAASNIRVVEPGRRFTPYEVAHPDQKYEEHVVLKATHWIVDRSYETAGDEPEYRNTFEAMPSRIPATPHRELPRPQVAGAQVGIIAGPEGEEIHCDKYGRIKLWFPWDRRAKKDGSDTCWVRVSQNWAGGGWGGQVIPRIGMEAMVSFVDGDPDRPLVTSLVPNPRQKVPYDLPGHKTKSVFRTDTHKGVGFNEISFEDERDQERIYLHAERDNEIHVQNNRAKRVDVSEVESIGNSKFSEIGKDYNFQIGGNAVTAVGVADVQINTKKPMQPFDDGPLRLAYSTTVTGRPDPTRGHYKLLVAQSRTEDIGTQSTTRIGDSATTSIGTGHTLNVGAKQMVSVDLPLNFHPAATGARLVFTPVGAE